MDVDAWAVYPDLPSPSIGTRLSFDGALCTVRYVGKVEGATGQWYGVEWDNPSRGKHLGEHRGVKYFQCKSKSPTAGSFVRHQRVPDIPIGFRHAVRAKYASSESAANPSSHDATVQPDAGHKPIEISGKVVEEVGFDQIRKKLAALQELKIVILDGMRVLGVFVGREEECDREEEKQLIRKTCPKITELDLSRNLISDWREITDICEQLDDLRILKLNGNRFSKLDGDKLLHGVRELSLEETLLKWEEICSLSCRFPDLRNISLSTNQLSSISTPISSTIKDLTLDSNQFCSLQNLSPLTSLPNLERLSVRKNKISKIQDDDNASPLVFSSTLTTLDISLNQIDSWSFIDALPAVFPGLTNLRISDNPLYYKPPAPSAITGLPNKPMTVDEAYMLTLSRLPQLQILNYGKIAPQDRVNGELYYLSLIRKELSATPASAEKQILSSHPRFSQLCELYGTPEIKRVEGTGSENPRALAARLVDFTFYIHDPDMRREFRTEIPRTFDIYRIKAIVARHYWLDPLTFKLIWETEEWDPVEEGTAAEDEWDSSDEGDQGADEGEGKKKFVRREEEFVDSTRAVEHWLSHDTCAVRVRVEMCSRSIV